MFPNPNHHRYRMQQWLDACNNPKIRQRDPILVYKQYRMCRLHFDNDCFNGACKRLLETAVPTLRLNLETSNSSKPKGSPRLQLSENELEDHTIAIVLNSHDPIEYDTEYLENATEASTTLEDWRADQRFSKNDSIDIEMKAVDENIDNEGENYIELYEEEDLFEAENGKHDNSKW